MMGSRPVLKTRLEIVGPVYLLAIAAIGCAGCSLEPRKASIARSALESQTRQAPTPTTVSTLNDHNLSLSNTIQTVAYEADAAISNIEYEENDAFRQSNSFTLAELEQLAMTNNPAIKQASAIASRAAGIRDQVGFKPNPQVGYFGDEIGDNDAAGLHGAFVSQTFVTADKLARNRHVLSHDVQSMLWQVEAQRTRVRTDLRKHFYRALAAQRRLALAREFRSVAEQGVSIAEKRLDAGGTRPDVLQSEIQINEIELLVRSAEFELDAAWTAIAATTGLSQLEFEPLVGELNTTTDVRTLDDVFLQIVSESPLVRAAEQEVCRARANLDRQRAQARPNVTGQLGVGHDAATGDEFANVQFSVPLPVHNANQGNIRAAYAAHCEASQKVERIKMKIREDLAMVMREYRIARETVQQYEMSILPKARETQDLISAAYAAGEFDFLRVLTARRGFFDANLRYVAALTDLAIANATIDGLLLSGGLSTVTTYAGDDSLRGQAISGQ